MKEFWSSRKNRVLILDTIVSIAVFFATHYLAPQAQEPVLFLIGALQPVFLAVIAGVAYEDGRAKSAGLVFSDGAYKKA